jgi:hypothetical protein
MVPYLSAILDGYFGNLYLSKVATLFFDALAVVS